MKVVYNPKAEENSTYLRSIAKDVFRKPTLNSIQMAEIASLVATSGFSVDGIEILNYAISKDTRNLDAINLLAKYFEELNQPEMALNLRLRIIELDPYNAKNYYQLGIIYKTLGDIASMEKMQKMILSFARDTPEGAAALKDLVP
jgi:tetratricopeptide (TPR) repeat protein